VSADQLQLRMKLSRAEFELDVDLAVPARGITVLFGASGSGKTSVLRCVAGLERSARGAIRIAGECWQDDNTRVFLPSWARSLGYVFQEPSLFEHLDVRGNLQYGLRRAARGTASGSLDKIIDLLGIRSLLQRRPVQLSGGERQRVAIARALATQPRLLLLDEPLAALDYPRRSEVMPWLEQLRDELNMPMLYVTHSLDELARLADHVVVLDRGRVTAQGPVAALFSADDNPLIFGDDAGALLHGKIVERDAQWHLARAAFAGGSLWLRDTGLATGSRVRLRVLARDVSLTTRQPQQTSIQNCLPCVVDSVMPDTHPAQALLRVNCGTSPLLARITRRAVDELRLQPGTQAWAQVKSVALID
jgi:molybdate transport system ATP-binding protein